VTDTDLGSAVDEIAERAMHELMKCRESATTDSLAFRP
jgi:hypothetical protein